jgi:predicted nuclease of predicted toxin-antitoxin system
MRFKLDENLSRSVAELFRAAGHDVMTVGDQQLRGAADERVFEVATREGRALVTLDRDLGQILRFPPDESPGIIVIDPGPWASHRGLLEGARDLLAMVETRSPTGALCIVEAGRVRVHLAHGDE